MTRNEAAELLEAYTLFLQNGGYLDTDSTCEEPTGIDQFMESIKFGEEQNVTVFWKCPGCSQETNESRFICCCSQECLKQWLELNKKHL